MALLEKTVFDAWAPITADEAKTALANDGLFEDDPALRLVLQDANRAEVAEAAKSWVMGWQTASTLYQSPYSARYWEGSNSERSSIPFFTVATAVNALVPATINGLFYEPKPFLIQKRPGTTALAAEAIGDVLEYQLEDINFREELRLGVMNVVLFGTGIWKYGWETSTRERTVYRRATSPTVLKSGVPGAAPISLTPLDEELEEEVITEYVDRPSFEHVVNLRHVLVDPGLNVPNIQKAKYVVHRLYPSWEDLDKLRERPGFNIPSKEKLLELFLPPKEPVDGALGEMDMKNPLWDARSESRYESTTVDPFNQPLEVLERWDKKRYTVVLQKKLVICNDENPYGDIPFLSVGWWDVPEAFWSLGLSKTIGSEQRLQQGITNLWLDNAALNLNGVFVRVMGKSIPTQSIRVSPGKIVNVEEQGDFQPLKRLDAVPEALEAINMSQSRAEQVSGANEMTSQGVAGASGHSNAARSAAGINMLTAGAGNRIADFVEKLSNNVIVPFLYSAHEMNRALLPVATLKYILNDELEHEYTKQNGDIVELLNSRVKFSIFAGAKMQARRSMAQALPILIQFLTSEQTTQQLSLQHKKVDVAMLLKMMFEVSDWRNYYDVVVPMTPEEEQRAHAMSPAGQQQAKAQGAAATQQKQFENKAQLADQNNTARAANQVLRMAFEKSAEPFETTGTSGGAGFGSGL